MAMAIVVYRQTEATENRALKTAFSTKTWTKRMATKKAAAVTNHLSCWRSSPREFLKRTAAETNPIRLRPTTAKYDPTRNGANGLAEAGQSLVSWTRGLDLPGRKQQQEERHRTNPECPGPALKPAEQASAEE